MPRGRLLPGRVERRGPHRIALGKGGADGRQPLILGARHDAQASTSARSGTACGRVASIGR